MYDSLKRIAKSIIPKKILSQNEKFFRQIVSLRYRGNSFQCNICEYKLNRFVILADTDLLCPNCGSRSRTRRLYSTLKENGLLQGNILHFSPPKSLYKKFNNLEVNYYSSDFENEFTADYKYDITAIAAQDKFFDLVICYHILEHVEDDGKAMQELLRVLKPNGKCYIQTPYKEGDIYEDISITLAEQRLKAFGQQDHVRIYSVEGLEERLHQAGFTTKRLHFDEVSYFGFKKETVIVATKS
ncbi:class I SAM-dependent methyltransferase [Winogradskyella ursingii]|uniref:class I SAM-dependent methyltransferase n=1 Tax=Winogradskyella ursingii TaxID=2686079 RepID=UPI0015CB3FA6|nr:class I SAM-dependent methyltransferase [Winogradskyella ursingii]